MRYNHIRRAALALVLLITPAVLGQQPRFEAVLSGRAVFGCFILPVSTPTVDWFTPDAHYPDARPSAINDLASAPGRPVYAVSGGNIFTIQPDGTRALFFDGVPTVNAITVASSGRVFARTTAGLAVISAAGVLETTHAFPDAIGMIAVATDGCTIYYEKVGAIGRIHGCTGVVLTDFTLLPGFFMDLYPLPNGNVLISTDSTIVLYDASGTAIRTIANRVDYGFDENHAFQQVAASPDGQILYVALMNWCDFGPNSVLLTALMQDGNELSRREMADTNDANALVVGSASVPGVPTASETALLMLAIVLAISGALGLKS